MDWRGVDPTAYSHVVFVCGPFGRGPLEAEFLGRFADNTVIGVDLSMLAPLDRWDPFDRLIERDSSDRARPDIVFLSRKPLVPVVGICLVEPYEGARVAEANAAIRGLITARDAAVVEIDTRLDENATGLRSAAEVESLIARVDALVTTRLYGMVLALKNGVPPIAIDPEVGGAKIVRQAGTLGWPLAYSIDKIESSALRARWTTPSPPRRGTWRRPARPAPRIGPARRRGNSSRRWRIPRSAAGSGRSAPRWHRSRHPARSGESTRRSGPMRSTLDDGDETLMGFHDHLRRSVRTLVPPPCGDGSARRNRAGRRGPSGRPSP